MKTCMLFFLFACLHITLLAQTTKGDFYIFKKDGSPVSDVKQATFLQHIFHLDDTTYISRYYNFAGPMIVQESYRDSNLTIPNGRFCWYNASGTLDSSGIVVNSRKEGSWSYVITKNETRTVRYENGTRIKEEILQYDDNGKRITTTNNDTDKVKDPIQMQAVFKNGKEGWRQYIQKNLRIPERFESIMPTGDYTTLISFVVDKQGNIKDVFLQRSCEWSSDAESLRLITFSPPWQPAIQFGQPVIYRQMQPITYQINGK